MTSMAASPTWGPPSLTTTFIPPPACTANHLTMMEDLAWEIYVNEPVPAPNVTITSCYPSQFGTSWISSAAGTSLPAFSPLVCPQNYITAMNNSDGYIACCPRYQTDLFRDSGYSLAQPTTLIANRPAYGAKCYTPITTVTVTSYNNFSLAGTKTMTYTSGAQAYAHPIDGFALISDNPSTITSTTASSIASAGQVPTSTLTSEPSSHSNHLSSGAIAGIIIGSITFVLLLLAALFLVIRNKKQRAVKGRDRKSQPHELRDKDLKGLESTRPPVELHGDSSPVEVDGRAFLGQRSYHQLDQKGLRS